MRTIDRPFVGAKCQSCSSLDACDDGFHLNFGHKSQVETHIIAVTSARMGSN